MPGPLRLRLAAVRPQWHTHTHWHAKLSVEPVVSRAAARPPLLEAAAAADLVAAVLLDSAAGRLEDDDDDDDAVEDEDDEDEEDVEEAAFVVGAAVAALPKKPALAVSLLLAVEVDAAEVDEDDEDAEGDDADAALLASALAPKNAVAIDVGATLATLTTTALADLAADEAAEDCVDEDEDDCLLTARAARRLTPASEMAPNLAIYIFTVRGMTDKKQRCNIKTRHLEIHARTKSSRPPLSHAPIIADRVELGAGARRIDLLRLVQVCVADRVAVH